jgi:hypothetical protein
MHSLDKLTKNVRKQDLVYKNKSNYLLKLDGRDHIKQ